MNNSRMVVLPPEETGGMPVKIWATRWDEYLEKYIPDIDETAYRQATQSARLPCVAAPVLIMADGHAGYGVPIGCVLATKGAIIPNAVGVDIGCGMCAWNSGVHIDEIDVRSLMIEWKKFIPHGEGKERAASYNDPVTRKVADSIEYKHEKMKEEFGKFHVPPDFKRFRNQLGTLGGGNHFVELQKDPNGIVWIMIHSGSRGYGAQTARMHHEKAVDTCRKYFSKLETKELSYLPTDSEEGQYYIAAMNIAQEFALENRFAMMRAAQYALKDQVKFKADAKDVINIHHNYASLENHGGNNVWVHRKGATLARKGTIGIIPGSMTTKSYIVEGKGSKESLNSCSHGSGRNFSRKEAKRRIAEGVDPSQESQLNKASVELYGTRNAHDELGSAYKDINQVMTNQEDLVDIKVELLPIAVLKG